MNIFTKKNAETEAAQLPIDPVDLFKTCRREEQYGYLRDIQAEVLKEWHSKRSQKDTICKMNTGSGKTMTGLLMLYSKMTELQKPALYVCPDNQLVEQTIKHADAYGIPVCTFDGSKNFPSDFLNSKKILVCNFHKLFNGWSVFNRDNISLGAVLLDDAHKCVDIARQQSTLTLPRKHPIADSLFKLFTESLRFQSQGSFHRLESGDPNLNPVKVPYWSWMDDISKVIKIISDYVKTVTTGEEENRNEDTDGIKFKWDLMAENLLEYDCYISGEKMEITPIHTPYHEIPAFNEAEHRFILSATFEDDYDLIRDLGISHESILNPIVPKDRADVGCRLILAPERVDSDLLDPEIKKFIAKYPKQGYNTVILVPSEHRSKPWVELGATPVDTKNIDQAIEKLKTGKGNFMVFINRYDGLDLHGNLCRVLIIDGLPLYSSLQEHYTEVRLDSLRAGKKAQIIEQGLGRGVRSGSDHCVVYLLGKDLISFLGRDKNMEYFTPVTRAQLNMGLKLLDDAGVTDTFELLAETAKACLVRDGEWEKFHSGVLSKVLPDTLDDRKKHLLELAELERLSLIDFRQRKYQPAADRILSQIAGKEENGAKERAWYYQFAAQLMYKGDKVRSNDLQARACAMTTRMFHPPQGYQYKKLAKGGAQASMVMKYLSQFERPQDVTVHINSILKEIVYTDLRDAKDFEMNLAELGRLLGFVVQMPEGESGNGPDVLWIMNDGHFLILEAKSRSTHSAISRKNVSQLLHSETWFHETYGTGKEYTMVTLQPQRKKGDDVSIKNEMRVIDQESLNILLQNLAQFGEALKKTNPKDHSEETVARLLEVHKFTPGLFRNTYLKTIKN